MKFRFFPQHFAAAKSLQSCLTLCNPIDCSPPGSPIHGILQARTLEWVAISFSNAWKWKLKVKSLSLVQLFGTPWICILPGSFLHGIFQARVLEWVAIVNKLWFRSLHSTRLHYTFVTLVRHLENKNFIFQDYVGGHNINMSSQ